MFSSQHLPSNTATLPLLPAKIKKQHYTWRDVSTYKQHCGLLESALHPLFHWGPAPRLSGRAVSACVSTRAERVRWGLGGGRAGPHSRQLQLDATATKNTEPTCLCLWKCRQALDAWQNDSKSECVALNHFLSLAQTTTRGHGNVWAS